MLAFIFYVVSFGLNTALYRAAARAGYSMKDTASCAMLLAGVALLPLALSSSDFRRIRKRPGIREWTGIIVVLIIGGISAFWSLSEGVRRAGAARAGFFLMAIPAVTIFIETLAGIRLKRNLLREAILLTLGGLLLAAPGFAGASAPRDSGGDLLLVIAVLSFAASNVGASFAMRSLSHTLLAGFRGLTAGASLLLVGADPLRAGAFGIVSGILTVLFLFPFYYLVRRYGAGQGALGNIYASLIAATTGVVVFGETMTMVQWTGAVIILGLAVRIAALLRGGG